MAEYRNNNFKKAKAAKNDEFYTQLSDIEKELQHYKHHFKDKVVYCNCDDPRVSNFFHYFYCNFEKLGHKKLITACYKDQSVGLFGENKPEKAIYLEYNGDKIPNIEEIEIKHLQGDGDFRSKESIELLKQADIVVTNPPFSLFREYVAQLIGFDKKFLIIGNKNAITYREIFKLIKDDKLRTGYTNFNVGMSFVVPDHWKKFHHIDDNGKKIARVSTSCWYTNLEVKKHKEDLILSKKYNEADYLKYDNYDAININKLADIPMDYKGAMGVPITFIDKYNPKQFEILGITDRGNNSGTKTKTYTKGEVPNVGDLNRRGVLKIGNEYKSIYARILIKNKRL